MGNAITSGFIYLYSTLIQKEFKTAGKKIHYVTEHKLNVKQKREKQGWTQ